MTHIYFTKKNYAYKIVRKIYFVQTMLIKIASKVK